MSYKKIIKEALKKRETVYEYGCVMVNLNVKEKDWDKLQKMVDEEDIYYSDVDPTGFGRELDPHVTILFGIHADVPDEKIEYLIDLVEKPDVQLQKISSFSNEKKPFDVLKFDVESEDLTRYNQLFKKLPHTSDFPDYHPHVTICYLKKGLAEKYVKKMANIEPIIAEPNEITYSKPDGKNKNYPL